MAECAATIDHCCWFAGAPCSFLEENIDGRRWSCQLRRTLGSWDAVHEDDRYKAAVRPLLDLIGLNVDCGDWPRPGERCATCGVVGDG